MHAATDYTIPCIRGVQATREYYVGMVQMKDIPRLFLRRASSDRPGTSVQRPLNKARIPRISRYLVEGSDSYVLPAITVTVGGAAEFECNPAFREAGFGVLKIPSDARIVVNDGQHRCAAIASALESRPQLAYEALPCVFFIEMGTERSQQVFADLNRYSVRPATSLSILFDHRDPDAQITRQIVRQVSGFSDIIDAEHATLPSGSPRLFTLSAIHQATRELLADHSDASMPNRVAIGVDYWNTVAESMMEWSFVSSGYLSAFELKREYVSVHGITLLALGRVGRTLLATREDCWREHVAKLEGIDWRRSNRGDWEGRVFVGDRIVFTARNAVLFASRIKQHLGLPLTNEEIREESRLSDAHNVVSGGYLDADHHY